jgi:tRNA 2-thiocytidine biosynthesis protein TtcA
MGQAIGDFGLVEADDRILVAISGGKDSFALLHTLDLHRRRAPFEFALIPVYIDAGWDPAATPVVVNGFARLGFEVEVVTRDIRNNVEECLRPGSNPCALCARLRRGLLYDLAPERGCNKIALGHHLDDLIETLLLNLFFTGQIKSMAIELESDDGRNRVIRPLAYVEEQYLIDFAAEKGFEPVELKCPYHAGKLDPQRKMVKKIIEQLASRYPRTRRSIFAALKHIRPSHLMDPHLDQRSSLAADSSEEE